MHGQGNFADLIRRRFRLACKRLGLNAERDVPLDTTRFRPPVVPARVPPAPSSDRQLDLF
jgi:hypothetical protein